MKFEFPGLFHGSYFDKIEGIREALVATGLGLYLEVHYINKH